MIALKLVLTPRLIGMASVGGRRWGPVVSGWLIGLISPLPIFATIFAVFTHHLQGATAARQVLHGVIVSSFACAVFFLVVAGLLEHWGILATFSGALLAALLIQGCSLWLARRDKSKLVRG